MRETNTEASRPTLTESNPHRVKPRQRTCRCDVIASRQTKRTSGVDGALVALGAGPTCRRYNIRLLQARSSSYVIPRKDTMPTDVIMPQMGESIFEGTITKWLKQPGEKVQRDEPLFEISTDKVDAEIPAPASGTLQDIKVQAGATVQVNTVVGTIAGEGEAAGSRAIRSRGQHRSTRPCRRRRQPLDPDRGGAASQWRGAQTAFGAPGRQGVGPTLSG